VGVRQPSRPFVVQFSKGTSPKKGRGSCVQRKNTLGKARYYSRSLLSQPSLQFLVFLNSQRITPAAWPSVPLTCCTTSRRQTCFASQQAPALFGRHPHWRESRAPRASAPFAGFLSVGPLAAHERKFSRDFKEIFLRAYRRFESPLVRQQVSDITRESVHS
jgi:hypothetical protein